MTAKTSAFAGQLKHFAQTAGMPRYQANSGPQLRTLIVLPLSCRNRIDVFCVESAEYIEITGVADFIFEAGMLHARTSASADSDEDGPSGWIPIREDVSPQAPFDFANERISCAPRSRNGELNESRLCDLLNRRIHPLLRDGRASVRRTETEVST